MNNADKIRSMNNEELAEWLDKISNQDREDWCGIGCCSCIYYGTHHANKEYIGTKHEYLYQCKDCEFENGILGWLQSENNGEL